MSSATMQAAVSRGVRQIEVDQLPVPEPDDGQVRIRIEACGICGSDIHLFNVGGLIPGRVPGHEMMGVVDAVAGDVSGVSVGSRVAVEPTRCCGDCPCCDAGRGNICRESGLLGIHANGGLAEYAVANAERLFPVPDDLPASVAALAEPLAVSLHGLRRVAFEPGCRVLVLGAGSVGLLTTLAAKALGAGEILVTARHPHQVEAAEALGAHRVLGESKAGLQALDRLGRRRPMDVVVETVGGQADTLNAAAAAVRPGGSVSVLGFFMGPVSLNATPLLLKEVTLAWSYCYDRQRDKADFAEAVDILVNHRDEAARLITHTLPLQDAPRAFETAADRKAGALKVSVTSS